MSLSVFLALKDVLWVFESWLAANFKFFEGVSNTLFALKSLLDLFTDTGPCIYSNDLSFSTSFIGNKNICYQKLWFLLFWFVNLLRWTEHYCVCGMHRIGKKVKEWFEQNVCSTAPLKIMSNQIHAVQNLPKTSLRAKNAKGHFLLDTF